MAKPSIEEMAAFAKKKGLVYPSSEIYGKLAGFWDFGPQGVELKNNIKRLFWKRFVWEREDIVGIDGAIITHPRVWEASGHTEKFNDIMLVCTGCKEKYRADLLIADVLGKDVDGVPIERIDHIIENERLACPKCNKSLSKGAAFNLMFETNVGAGKDPKSVAYLRPETAQVIFTDFKQVLDTARVRLPFGIAQTGKAFRNEISPRDFLFRSREFEQFEIEFFVDGKKKDDCPLLADVADLTVAVLFDGAKEAETITFKELVARKKAGPWHAYWLAGFCQFFLDYGIRPESLRLREHAKDELAHYAAACFDIEYRFPSGWKEIHGNADRTTFDLDRHAEFSGKELAYFDEETREKVRPYVASEPSQGIERALLAFLYEAYDDDKERGNIVLRFHPQLAPTKVAVFPLVGKLDAEARKVFGTLRKAFVAQFDRSGSIGRRYARADELGIPYCVTVDFEGLEDGTVTVRDRETTAQARVRTRELAEVLGRLLEGGIAFSALMKE
ncbi:glycine--tRNA ligase [Candidatus Woesearchaeota archaeon]|nr:glycine--tRNA ligase [Candidatus Woesearchaeota archaeon]